MLFLLITALLVCCLLAQTDAQLPFIKAFAGTGSGGAASVGDDGPATSASLNFPSGIWLDPRGNLFIADTYNHRVRKVDAQTNNISTIAGTGVAELGGDGGPATSATLYYPQGVYVSSTGEVFIADKENHRIRTISSDEGIISTFAGSLVRGKSGNSGDGGPGTSARMSVGKGIVVDSLGDVYVTESENRKIRKISASTGIVTAYAGNGSYGFSGDGGPAALARLNYPKGLAMDTNSNIYFCDDGNYRIRKVFGRNKTITTIAGSGSYNFADGPASSAGIPSGCEDVWVDSIGNVFFVNGFRIRKIDTVLGIVSTIAGMGLTGSPPSNVIATSVNIGYCFAVTGDSAGNIYFSDYTNSRIYKVSTSEGYLTHAVGTGSYTFNTGVVGTSAGIGTVKSLFLDTSGNLYLGDHSSYRLRVINVFDSQSLISDVIGNGLIYLAPDGTPSSSASIGHVSGIWKDSFGNIFIVDSMNYRVQKLDVLIETISTLLGNGFLAVSGSSGDGGPATSALLQNPTSVIGDTNGVIFISDTNNHVIRKVENGTISVFAGTLSSYSFTGDGGPATSASLSSPQGMWLMTDGTLFFADYGNHRIRKVSSSGGKASIISTVLGNGIAALSGDEEVSSSTSVSLNFPEAVFVSTDNSMYVVDNSNHRIRMVDGLSNIISTIAGQGFVGIPLFAGDSRPGTSASLNSPKAITLDSSGNLLVADFTNRRVRKLSISTNIMSTVAGPNVLARPLSPQGVFVDANNNILIADTSNHYVRMKNGATGAPSIIIGNGQSYFNGDQLTGTSTSINNPYSVWKDSAGAVLVGEYGRVRKMNMNGIVTTIAGVGYWGPSPDGNVSTNSFIGNVYHVYSDRQGIVFFTDAATNKIRTITVDGKLGTFAGNGSFGFSSAHENVPATSASFANPSGFWFDSEGNCFIADSWNNRIRKVTAGSRLIYTVAGNGMAGLAGDGGLPLQASLNGPWSIVGDSVGILYVTESNNHRVRKIDLINNIISTLIGSGTRGMSGVGREVTFATSSFLSGPSNIAVDTLGQVYFSDSSNNKVRILFSAPFPTGQPTAQPSSLPTQPTSKPSLHPTSQPSSQPTCDPSSNPSAVPTGQPTGHPSSQPTTEPSARPSKQPSSEPTNQPSAQPTAEPSSQPIGTPSSQPSAQPTVKPSAQPTNEPSIQPFAEPTAKPSAQPTNKPSSQPSIKPSAQPSDQPTSEPSTQPSVEPTARPTSLPSNEPSTQPSNQPSTEPTGKPSARPTTEPSSQPSAQPTAKPTSQPSNEPSTQPSAEPSGNPSSQPTMKPSSQPSTQPSTKPSAQPTSEPSAEPSRCPSSEPSLKPTSRPSIEPSSQPSSQPTVMPSAQPSREPSSQPLAQPTATPTSQPSSEPSSQPSAEPTAKPCSRPTNKPSSQPSIEPTAQPSAQPTVKPSDQPTSEPSALPTVEPSAQHTSEPSSRPSRSPSIKPSGQPICKPSAQPTNEPSLIPSSGASTSPAIVVTPPKILTLLTLPLKTSLEVNIALDRDGLVFLSVFDSLDALPSSSDEVLARAQKTTSSQRAAHFRIDNLLPAATHFLYVVTQSSTGTISTWDTIQANKTAVQTLCCREITSVVASPIVTEGVDVLDLLTVRLLPSPSTAFTLSLSLKSTTSNTTLTDALVPNLLSIPASSSSQLLSFKVSLLSGIPVGTYALEVQLPFEMQNIYSQNVTNSELTVVSTTTPLPAPSLISARFENDGTAKIAFDRATNQGGVSSYFICDVLFLFACAEISYCQWIDDSSAVIIQMANKDHCAVPGSALNLATTARIRARSATSSSSSQISSLEWPFVNVSTARSFSMPSDPMTPSVLLSVSESVSICGSLLLDATVSTGHGERSWKNITISVTSMDANKAIDRNTTQALNAYLQSSFRVSPPILLDSSMLVANRSLHFTLTLCNFLGACGMQNVSTWVAPSSVLAVYIAGSPHRVLTMSQPLSLSAVGSLSQCGSTSLSSVITYEWKVWRLNTHTNVRELQPSIVSQSKDTTKFTLSSYSLQKDTLCIIQVVAHSGILHATSSVNVSVRSGSFRLVLKGGIDVERQVRAGGSLSLDAGGSFHEDIPGLFGVAAGLQFAWSCMQLEPKLNSSCAGVLINGDQLAVSTDRMNLFPRADSAEAKIRIFLSITDATASHTSSASVNVVILPPLSMTMALSSNVPANAQKINPDQQLMITAELNVASSLSCTVKWSLQSDGETGMNLSSAALSALSHSFSFSTPSTFAFNLVLAKNALVGGRTYKFIVSSETTNPGISSSFSISVTVNSPPQPGEFTVSPREGMELSDAFLFSCSQWRDVDLPLSFQFGHLSASNSLLTLRSRQEASTVSSLLPAGPTSRNHSVTCTAHVFDGLLASSTVESIVTVIGAPLLSLEETKTRVSASLSALMNSTDVNTMQQATVMNAHLLNKANCSAAPDCAKLNRLACYSTSHTCGPCISSQYLGDDGDSNSACVSMSDVESNVPNSTNATQNETSVKRCPNDCSGRGACLSQSYFNHAVVPRCPANALDCYVQCSCFGGFRRKDCVLTVEEMEQRMELRTQVVDVVLYMYDVDNSANSLHSLVQTMNEAILQPEEISLSTAQRILHFANASLSVLSGAQDSASTSTMETLLGTVDTIASVLNSYSKRHGEEVLDVLQYFAKAFTAQMVVGQQSIQITQKHIRMNMGVYSYSNESMSFAAGAAAGCMNISLALPLSMREIALNITPSIVMVPLCPINASAISMSSISLSSQLFTDLESDTAGLQLSTFPCNDRHDNCNVTLKLRRTSAPPPISNSTLSSSETVNITCEEGFQGEQDVSCMSGGNVTILCNGTYAELLVRCPATRTEPRCSMLGNADENDESCTLIDYDDDSISCSCSLSVLSATKHSRRLAVANATDLTLAAKEISVNYVSMLKTVTSTFTATVLSAGSLSASEVSKGWQALVVVGSLAATIALTMFGGHYLDNYDGSKSKIKPANDKTSQVERVNKKHGRLSRWVSSTENNHNELAAKVAADNAKANHLSNPMASFLKLAEEALPQVLRSRSLSSRFTEELKRYHRWGGVFFHFSHKFPRMLRVAALATNIITMLFMQSLTYNLTNSDDGSCERLLDETSCLEPRSGFATGTSKCFWTNDPSSATRQCAFVEPDSDMTVMIFVAVFSAIVSTPIALSADWVIQNVLAAPMLHKDRVQKVQPLPLNATENSTALDDTHSVVPINGVTRLQKNKGASLFDEIDGDNSLAWKAAERDFEKLQQHIVVYRTALSPSERKEFDEVWGLDSEGRFQRNENQVSPGDIDHAHDTFSLSRLTVHLRGMLSGKKDNNCVVLSELRDLHVMLTEEKMRFSSGLTTEKKKNQRLFLLFQKDLMPGISGQILEAKERRDDLILQRRSRSAKLVAWVCLGVLNVGMLFYIFLFAVSQTVHRQRAWANSFAMWLVVEVFVVSSSMVLFMHVLIPLLAMRDVVKLKQRLLESLQDYQRKIASNRRNNNKYNADPLNNAEDVKDNDDEIAEDEPFNAAKFLFLSHKMAELYPHLKVAQIIAQFSTPWPKQSYLRVTDVTKNYEGKFSGISKSLATVLMFFVTGFLSVPPSIQDMAMQISTTAVMGYTMLVHVQLYKIYPVLIVIPTLVIAAIVHFFVKSSRATSEIERMKLLQHNNNDLSHGSVGKEEPQDKRPQQTGLQHISRRASVAHGVALAKTVEKAFQNEFSIGEMALSEYSLSSFSSFSDHDSLPSTPETIPDDVLRNGPASSFSVSDEEN